MELMKRLVFFGLFAALLVGACSQSSPSGPSQVNVPYGFVDLRVGTGAEAGIGRQATVNYTGWLYNVQGVDNKGTQFDTSLQAGRTPYAFIVGQGVIQGFSMGVNGMKVGGLRRVTIPPSLGYGAQGSGTLIPPNATLIFDLELVSVP
jgi:FKBP-type peptidyl-prolyl cis-trans isomerase FkpA